LREKRKGLKSNPRRLNIRAFFDLADILQAISDEFWLSAKVGAIKYVSFR
tara:strand:+ start:1345 stop:1494 length:150 start_codon:yes stop_codon:yes gene_type:complete